MEGFQQELRTGWRDLLAAGIGLGFGIGSYTPVSSLFFRALEGRFGWSKSAAVASLVALPLTGLVLPLVGALTDRLGVRRVAACAAAGMAACLFGLSFLAGRLAVFYLLILGLNVLGSGTGPIAYTRPVVRSFPTSRGVALSVALLGIAVSGVLLPFLFGPLLAAGHWQTAYRLYAAIALTGGIAAALLIRSRSHTIAHVAEHSGVQLRAALASRSFWLLAFAILFISAASLGMLTQFQSLMVERGLSPVVSARLISVLALSVSLSRLVVGRALDVRSPSAVAATTLALSALGAALLLFPATPVLLTSALAAMLVGLSVGAELDLLSFFCARCFGLRRYGSIYGALGLFFYVGIAAGGIAYGKIHDASGSYHLGILMSTVLLFASATLFFAMGAPHRGLRR